MHYDHTWISANQYIFSIILATNIVANDSAIYLYFVASLGAH